MMMEGKDVIDKDDLIEIQNRAKKLIGTHVILSNRDGSYFLFKTTNNKIKVIMLKHEV